MRTDSDGQSNEGQTEKIDVRVPAALLEVIEEEYHQRGYTSRSEAIRDALRDWANPPTTPSDETLEDLENSREQKKEGETVSAEETRERLELDD
ncbi:ribbon-helix-helix domain-containing protein [Halalkalicoccus subterraneus]|uniref:ribbon-helix-helix domain-containing protein n=1 Tax=Halalkalicoccus subterraneus TaxID=2675002 RepID=UPI000EFC7E6D|nr:ribbon-helix-helix domain-containing protein [Halalkalicoccus subterraneus]